MRVRLKETCSSFINTLQSLCYLVKKHTSWLICRDGVLIKAEGYESSAHGSRDHKKLKSPLTYSHTHLPSYPDSFSAPFGHFRPSTAWIWTTS